MSIGQSSNPGQDLQRLRIDFVSEIAAAVSRFDVTYGGSFAAAIEGCLAAGLTATELADEFKVNTSTISRWQSGRSVPGLFVRQGVSRRLVAMLQEKVVALSGP